ncbi:MAG: hypothetical protein R6V04_04570 [bacterium]
MYQEKGSQTMFFRFFLFLIIGYFGYIFIKSLIKNEIRKSEIRGKQKNEPINFDNEDIEDAKYEDIDEEE